MASENSSSDLLRDHPVLCFIRNIQNERGNIVVYSRLINAIAEIAWPIKPDGCRILATGLKEWLRARGLFIECLCPLVLDSLESRDPRSCRLVESMAGDVFAFCNQEHNGCGMRINLSAKVRDTIHDVSKYSHFKPTKGASVNHEKDMQSILQVYREAGHPNGITAPLLVGYIGEHISFYRPGTAQLAGTARYVIGTPSLTVKSRYQYHPYREHSLPRADRKVKYREIDDMDNPSAKLPSQEEIMSFTTRVGQKSKATTRIRKENTASSTRVKKEILLLTSSSSEDEPAPAEKVADTTLLDRLKAGNGLSRRQIFSELLFCCRKCGGYVLQSEASAHNNVCIPRGAEQSD